jgi:hypothetical protein
MTDTKEHAEAIKAVAFGRSKGKSIEVVVEEIRDRYPNPGWEYACAVDYTVRGNSSLDIKRFGARAADAAKVTAEVSVSQVGSAVKLENGGAMAVADPPLDTAESVQADAESVQIDPEIADILTKAIEQPAEAFSDPNAQHERKLDGTIVVTPEPVTESAQGGPPPPYTEQEAEILADPERAAAIEAEKDEMRRTFEPGAMVALALETLEHLEAHELAAMGQLGAGIVTDEEYVIYGIDVFGVILELPVANAFPPDEAALVFGKAWNERPRQATAWAGTD